MTPASPWLPLAGLAAFLATFRPGAAGGGDLVTRIGLLEPLLLLLGGIYLSRRLGAGRLLELACVLLGFGVVFPLVGVHVAGAYAFDTGSIRTIAGLPVDLPLAWCALVILAVSLSDAAVRSGRMPRWLAVRRPLATGLVLALMEGIWDPALLRSGLLVSATASLADWPLGFTPGWPAVHLVIGFTVQDLMDTWDDLGRSVTRRVTTALALALAPAGLFVLASIPRPPAAASGPWPALALLDTVVSAGAAAILLTAWLAVARRLRRGGDEAPRLLLTTVAAPFEPYDSDEYILDFYSSRFTKGQGPFVTESESPYLALHFLARNLSTPSRLLEYPTLEELEAELRRHPYAMIGISFVDASRPAARAICRLVRRVSPRTKIVLGGYGVMCLDRTLEEDDGMEGLFDAVCRGEGVAFMREMLGEDSSRPVEIRLPPQQVFPLGMRFMGQPMAPLVAGFGCAFRCEYCATSAFFRGTHVRIASAEQIAGAVRQAFRESPALAAVPIFDEDYLADLGRARSVGELLEDAPELPRGAAPISIFASLASLSRVSPAQLVGMRIGYVWVGLESKFSTLRKRGSRDAKLLLNALYDHGICVTGSFMLGLDEQTEENLQEDLEWLVELDPTTAQVGLLGPVTGTRLHDRAEEEGRILPGRWEDRHLYHEGMRYRHLKPGTAHAAMRRAYAMLYERNGPSVLRMWRAWLRGHLAMARSPDSRLRDRAHDLRRLLALARPAVVAVRRLGPNATVREMAATVLDLHARSVEEPDPAGGALGLAATAWTAWRSLKLRALGKPLRQPLSRRYRYGE